MAARAEPQARWTDLVLGATLVRARVGLSLLGNGHRQRTSVLVELQLPQRSPALVRLTLVLVAGLVVEVRAAQRAQPAAVFAAQDLHRQRQHERVARPGAEVEHALAQVGRAEGLSPARLIDLARVHVHHVARVLEAAHARAGQLRVETQAQRVAGRRVVDVQQRLDELARQLIALPAEVEAAHGYVELEPPPLTGAEAQPVYVEDLGALAHTGQVSPARSAPRGTGRDP